MKNRSRKDIEAFLTDLGKRRGIGEWQARQAEHAIRILCEMFLPRYTPERQATVAPAEKHPPQEAIAGADGFRDRVITGEVERQFPVLIEAFKIEKASCHTLRDSLRQASFDRLPSTGSGQVPSTNPRQVPQPIFLLS